MILTEKALVIQKTFSPRIKSSETEAVGEPTASNIGSKKSEAGKLKYQNFVCGFICACVAHNDQNAAIIGNIRSSYPGIARVKQIAIIHTAG